MKVVVFRGAFGQMVATTSEHRRPSTVTTT